MGRITFSRRTTRAAMALRPAGVARLPDAFRHLLSAKFLEIVGCLAGTVAALNFMVGLHDLIRQFRRGESSGTPG